MARALLRLFVVAAQARAQMPSATLAYDVPPGWVLDVPGARSAGVELYGSRPNRPPPHRVVILDSGDGFYSITYTAKTRAILALPEVDAFFDSLRLRSGKQAR